jgi:hypothetical protein
MLVQVLDDPRLHISSADRNAKNAALREVYQVVERSTKAYNRLKEAEKTLSLVESQFVNVPDSTKKEALKLGAALKDSIANLKDQFFQHKEEKGIKRGADNLNAKLYNALGYIGGNMGAPNSTTKTAMATAKTASDTLINNINTLLEAPWNNYRAKVEAIQYALFKDFERL